MNHKGETLDGLGLPLMDHPAPPGLEGDERWALVLRIVGGPQFRKSPRMRQFLLFVAERSLTDQLQEINEYDIGWKVFERGKEYNPSEDSIVRTTARQLRTKVKEYFDAEGVQEKWILDIPKGGYAPIFVLRDAEPALAPVPARIETGEPALLLKRHGDARIWQWLAGGLGAVAIGSMLFAFEAGRSSQHSDAVPTTLASAVLSRGQVPTRVVVGDFGLALKSIVVKRHFPVEEYANRSAGLGEAAKPSDPAFSPLWQVLGAGQIVSLPDAVVAAALLKLGAAERKQVVLQHASQIAARDLRLGNFILLSTPIANPWIGLFEDKLNFRYRLTDSASGVNTEIVNARPQSGEKAVYSAEPSTPDYGTTYGLVARIPNLSKTGKVMLIGGLKYTGFEAAGEFATDPKSAVELARLFHVSDVNQIPDFEVLIETYSLNAAPRDVKIAAFRKIQE